MKICAAADMHYPAADAERSQAIADRMCESGADVLLLAGDMAAGSEEQHRSLLGLFNGFAGPKLFVPGNHDLWSDDPRLDSGRRYRVTLPRLVESAGFHYLPGSPTVIGGVGFAGTVGWFDFAFRQAQSPQPGLRVTPLRARAAEPGPEVAEIPGRRDVLWEELTIEDYAGQALRWTDEGRPKQMVWNDALYVNWDVSDVEVAAALAEELRRDVAAVEPQSDRWVGVTHFLPFRELVGEPSADVEGAYVRAFAGSPLPGEVFASSPTCRLVLCGHWHRQEVIEIGEHLVVANCSVGDGTSGPLLLTLKD